MKITLEINDREIGRIGVHNEGSFIDSGRSEYGVYDLTRGERIETVYHTRKDGASTLAAKVLDTIDEDLLDE